MGLQTIALIEDAGNREVALRDWCVEKKTAKSTKMFRDALALRIWDARKLEVLIYVVEFVGHLKWNADQMVLKDVNFEIKRITERLENAQPCKSASGTAETGTAETGAAESGTGAHRSPPEND
jgi:hypothetical protein